MDPSSNYTSPHVAARNDDGSHEWEGLETDSNCTVYVEQGGAVVECADDENRLEDSANGAGVRVHPAHTQREPYSKGIHYPGSGIWANASGAASSSNYADGVPFSVFRSHASIDVLNHCWYGAASAAVAGVLVFGAVFRPLARRYVMLQVFDGAIQKVCTFDLIGLTTGVPSAGLTARIVDLGALGVLCEIRWPAYTAATCRPYVYAAASLAALSFKVAVNEDSFEVGGLYVYIGTNDVDMPWLSTTGAPASSLAPTVRCDGAQDRHLYNLARGVIRPRAHVIPLDAQAAAKGYPIWCACQIAAGYGYGWDLSLYVDTVVPFAAEWRLSYGPAPKTVDIVASSWAWTPGTRYSVTLEGLVCVDDGKGGVTDGYRIRVVDLDADAVVETVEIAPSSSPHPVDYSPTALLLGCSQLTDAGPLGHWNVIIEEVST